MPGSACIDAGRIDHGKSDVYEALGLSAAERDEVVKVVNDALKMRRISEMLEYIWGGRCSDLSLEARIYATLRLGMDLYALILESILAKGESEGGGKESKAS